MGCMGWMMVGLLLFGTLAVIGIVLLVRSVWTRTSGRKSDALRILRERYGRGEIEREEYEERRNVLQGWEQRERSADTVAAPRISSLEHALVGVRLRLLMLGRPASQITEREAP